MTHNLTTKLREPVQMNVAGLAALSERLGEVEAENFVCHAIEAIAGAVAQCLRSYHTGDWASVRVAARSMSSVAQTLEMVRLVGVATDVDRCIDRGDAAGRAATLTRLIRCAEQALSEVWDLQDVTI